MLKFYDLLNDRDISILNIRIYTVTDLIRELPGNGSVNSPTYTGGQQYSGGVC
jgi:hypothetical protein